MVEFIDWPREIRPDAIKVRAASSYIDGGLTRGSVAFSSPEPGGRWAVDLSFDLQRNRTASRLYGWLADELAGGTVVCFTVPPHVETVSFSELGYAGCPAPLPYLSGGVEAYHSDGTGLKLVPTGRTVGGAEEGDVTIKVDVGGYGHVLRHGHLFGHQHQVNRVRQISWSGSVATIECRLPLIAPIADNAIIRLLYPRLMVQVDRRSMQQFLALHDRGQFTTPGQITLMEYRA
jgi:hypothetical protein